MKAEQAAEGAGRGKKEEQEQGKNCGTSEI